MASGISKFDVWASLWNCNFGKKPLSFDNFEIFPTPRKKFSSLFFDSLPEIISSLNEEDKKLFHLLLQIYNSDSNRDFPPYILKTSRRFQEINQDDFTQFSAADQDIKLILFALRLFQPGDLRGRLISMTLSEDTYSPDMFFDIDSVYKTEYTYRIKPLNTERFDKFFSNLNVNNEDISHIAIERFNLSYNHASPIEKIIDLIISLEALFNKSPSDIRFKVAIRSAHLIGETSEEIHSYYTTVLKSYDLRNNIIHGNKIKFKQVEIVELSQRMNVLVREVLKKALDMRKSGFNLFNTNLSDISIDKVIVNTK